MKPAINANARERKRERERREGSRGRGGRESESESESESKGNGREGARVERKTERGERAQERVGGRWGGGECVHVRVLVCTQRALDLEHQPHIKP